MDAATCDKGRCQFTNPPGGSELGKNQDYQLCGPQAEPAAGLWLRETRPSLCLPQLQDVLAYSESGNPRFGRLGDVFPNTASEFKTQFDELLALQDDRDDVGKLVNPAKGRTAISLFLDLQPVPFGAVFNVSDPTTRPQAPVADVVDWRSRINLPRVVVTTGQELARMFEGETPGLYHRHALNWLLFNRPDVSPPRHARVWMALDVAVYIGLTAAWYYKWRDAQYRFLQRPSEYARRIGDTTFTVLYDNLIKPNGTETKKPKKCPTFSPGTPRHPAWPSGHSTYSAAASYLLEFFFSPQTLTWSDAAVAKAAAGVTGNPAKSGVWIANELRRLASNIGEARLWGGVHWRDDHLAGQRIGRAAAQAVIDRLLSDHVGPANLDDCEPRRDECPPHPNDNLPTSGDETVLQKVNDKTLSTAFPAT